MAEPYPRAGAASGAPAYAYLGPLLLVLMIIASVTRLRSFFGGLAPQLSTSRGWPSSDIATLLSVITGVSWVVIVLLALLTTYLCARRHMGWFAFIMSPRGRVSRRDYWRRCWLPLNLALLAAILIVAAGGYAASVFVWGHAGAAAQITLSVLTPYAIGAGLLLLWPHFCCAAKRLHDRGRPTWLLLVAIVPVIGLLWLFVEIGLRPGARGDNRFGPDPLASRGGIG